MNETVANAIEATKRAQNGRDKVACNDAPEAERMAKEIRKDARDAFESIRRNAMDSLDRFETLTNGMYRAAKSKGDNGTAKFYEVVLRLLRVAVGQILRLSESSYNQVVHMQEGR